MAGLKPLLETLGALMPLAKVPRGAGTMMQNYASKVDDVPMDWLQRMPGNDIRSEDKVRELMKLIEQQGLMDPLIINAGKESRTAMLGEGNHRLAALYRMGFDTAPARVMVGQQYGSRLQPRSFYGDDLIPQQGQYFSADARPSEVFRSLSGIGGR